MAGRAARTGRPDGAHPRHAPPHAGGAGAQHQIVQTALWLSLLRSCSGFDAFMRQHRGRVSRSEVVAFLFFEPRFPRSLRYCVQSALKVMERIWSDDDSTDAAHAIEILAGLDAWLGEKSLAPLPRSIHELLAAVPQRDLFHLVS